MTALMQYLGYAISFACILFATHFLRIRPVNRTPSLLLSAIFLVFAAQSAQLSILLETGTPNIVAIARPSFAMTIGPLLLLYFKSVAEPDFRLHWLNVLHFIPAAFIAIELASNNYWVDIDLAIIASFAAYTVILWLKIQRGEASIAHLGAGRRDAFRILLAGAVLLSVSLVGEIIITLDIMRGGAVSKSIPIMIALMFDLAVISVVILAALQRPSPFDWLYKFGAPQKGVAAMMTDADCRECIQLFEAEIGNYYLSGGTPLRLNEMAKRLSLPARRLSEAINRIYGESYSRRINRWRVAEAVRLLQVHPETTITEVMFDAGFKTKSSFNREFRTIQGMSPTEYRNSIMRDKISPDVTDFRA